MEFSLNICQHKVGGVSPRRRVGDSRLAPVYEGRRIPNRTTTRSAVVHRIRRRLTASNLSAKGWLPCHV
ncbi:MAG: hypothetical protein LBT05_00355 [Planctomycetaceae bacterium]|nr:hypothetical protein [Planctomycetaceae bacterium]